MEATAVLDKSDCHPGPMTVPVFKRGHHHELSDDAVLPFVRETVLLFNRVNSDDWDSDDSERFQQCEVFRIHPPHHNFWESSALEDEPLVLVKELSLEDLQDSKSILQHLHLKDYPHLVKPLATYRYKNKNYLMLPYANANLDMYWSKERTPRFDQSTVLWSLKQMQGIAHGLSLLHDIAPFHGDLTPMKILWFKNLPGMHDGMGILQIYFEFSLDSGWNSHHDLSAQALTTEPISSASDMWSLGCLYLDFITWLLVGMAGIEQFSELRVERGEFGFDTDSFGICRELKGRHLETKVKGTVIDWVGRLYQHQHCSAVMHDVLNLTMKCLLVEPGDRITASRLHGVLDRIVKRAAEDADYLLKPTTSMQSPVNSQLLEAEASIVDSCKQRPRLDINPMHITNISQWMQTCMQEHLLCQGPLEARLPSRILDLKSDGQSRIRLFEAKGAIHRYICLSHCWGDSVGIEDIKTTSKNLQNYLQDIDLESLPRTFREAVLVTRTLGIRYLWIDSLCILQDSEDDWARESSQMGRIFAGAYLVLAAAHSKDSSGGLLPLRGPPLVKLRPPKDGRAIFLQGVDHSERKYPLLQRAWVYQERFLARRVLFFLENELLWECAGATNCQCTRTGGNIRGWFTNDTYRRILNNPSKQDDTSFRSLWTQTVKRYSSLDLTYSKDKLPALSGIAKHILIRKEDEYLAGMWKSTLLADLAWRVEKSCTSRPNSWRAPTWSWTSVDGLVHIPSIKKQDCCAEMIDVYCKPLGIDPTGAVLEGSLVLRSQVIRSLRSAEGIPLCSYRDRLGERSATRIYLDFACPQMEPSSSQDAPSCCLRIGTLDNGMYMIEYFLIIQATNKEASTYERVGLLEIHRSQRVQGHSEQEEARSEINDITRAILESPFEVITIS